MSSTDISGVSNQDNSAKETERQLHSTLDELAMAELEKFAKSPDQLAFFCDKVTGLALSHKQFGTANSGYGTMRFPALTAHFDGTCIKALTGERDQVYVKAFGVIFALDADAGRLRCYKITTTDDLPEIRRFCDFRLTGEACGYVTETASIAEAD